MTSDSEPIRKNDSTPNTEGKSDVQADNPLDYVTPPLATSEPPPSPCHYEITCKPEKYWWDKIKPYAEIVGIVLLAVYTAYTIKMYCANKKAADAAYSAADTASKTLRASNRATWLDQRAWVEIATGDPEDVHLGEPIAFKIQINNTGKTPARNFDGHLVAEIINKGSSPKVGKHGHAAAHISIPLVVPGFHKTMQMYARALEHKVPKTISLTKEIAASFTSGESYLIAWGDYSYTDVWGVKHWTKFCDSFGSGAPSDLDECVNYNDIDSGEPN